MTLRKLPETKSKAIISIANNAQTLRLDIYMDRPGAPTVDDIIRKALIEQIQGNFAAATRCFLLAFKIQPAVAPDLRNEFLTALRSLSNLQHEAIIPPSNSNNRVNRSKASSRAASKSPKDTEEITEDSQRHCLESALPFWRLAASIYPNDVEVDENMIPSVSCVLCRDCSCNLNLMTRVVHTDSG